MFDEYPKWFMDAVRELEGELADGHIGHTTFNRAMEDLECELQEVEGVTYGYELGY